MHRLIEVDGVEALDLVSVIREEEPCVLEERALRVRDEEVGVELHDVRGDVVEGLARAGAADHEDVEVAVEFRVELWPVQREAVVLGEDEVVVLVGLVLEHLALLEGAPARAAALLTGAEVADEGDVPEPEEPDDDEDAESHEQGRGRHVDVRGGFPDEGPHGGERLAPVLEELPRIGGQRLAVAVAEVEPDDRDDEGSEGGACYPLVDLGVSLVCHGISPLPHRVQLVGDVQLAVGDAALVLKLLAGGAALLRHGVEGAVVIAGACGLLAHLGGGDVGAVLLTLDSKRAHVRVHAVVGLDDLIEVRGATVRVEGAVRYLRLIGALRAGEEGIM